MKSTILKMAAVALVATLTLTQCHKKTVQTPFEAYAQGHTQLVFKTVSFNQFIVKGTKAKINDEHFEQRKVFLVKGKGKFYFDLSLLEQDTHKTIDPEHPTLYLKVKDDAFLPEYLVSLDIDLNQSDIYPVENVPPAPISADEAKSLAKIPAAFEGGLGAYVGTKLARLAGPMISINPLKQSAVTIGTGGVFAAIGGIDGYIRSKNFLCGKTLVKADGPEEVEELFNEVKTMMAAELIELEDKDQEDRQVELFKQEIQEQLSLIMSDLGWEKTIIDFED